MTTDGGFEEAKIEGRRLRGLWWSGRRTEVIDTLKNAKAGPWFVSMAVAILLDGLDIGERGDLISALRAADAVSP